MAFRYSTKDLSISAAESFLHRAGMVPGSPSDEDTSSAKNSHILYACIGKSSPWANDPNPDVPPDNEQHLSYDVHRNFIGCVKIQPTSICHVTKRHDWVSGTVYAMWRDTDVDMYDRNFYVLTNENDVYKCLYNNKGGTSTVKPKGYSLIPFTLSDGYTWKYMYTIGLGDQNKFLTKEHMPVRTVNSNDLSVCGCSIQAHKTRAACEAAGGVWTCTSETDKQLEIQDSAANGAIHIIEVNDRGTGYQYVEEGVVVEGSATTIRLSTTVDDPPDSRDNYYNGASVYIKSGTGAGQLRRIIDYSGSSRTLVVNTAFETTPATDTTVIISPSVTIVGDGHGAQAYSRVGVDGIIANVNVISVGSGYTKALVRFAGNNEFGAGASANAIISPTGGHGSNPVRELYADKIMLDTEFNGVLGDSETAAGYIPAGVEFRSISVLQDPILKVNSSNEADDEHVANTSNSPNNLRMTSYLKLSYEGSAMNNRLEENETITTKFQYDRAVTGELEFVTELNPQERKNAAFANARLGSNGDIVFTERDPATPGDSSFYTVYINNEESYGNYKAFTKDSTIIRDHTPYEELATVELYKGPEANTFSGEILYTENFEPVTRDTDQIENFKIVIDF